VTEEPEEPNSDPASRDNKEKVAESEPPQPEPSTNSRFPIVGIGASAVVIEAFKQMLRALPDDTGMSFVLILHLDPTHISILAEILSGETRMPVSQVKGEVITEPNHVYVIPPGMSMIIEGGALQLLARTEPRGQHRPIDQFFRSLAEDQGHTCIGVILSGSATDGSLGLEEIKAAGGITFAQDQTAQHDSMPRSAIAAGCVDFVLPPDGIAEEIARIARHPLVSPMRPGKAEKAGAEYRQGAQHSPAYDRRRFYKLQVQHSLSSNHAADGAEQDGEPEGLRPFLTAGPG
jgi:two-component system CheB/CheR fusion protein